MQVVLVMFRNDGERRSFSVVRNMTIIGRREDCDLRIPVGDVSRKHCRLVRTDDGIRIEDLGSSNGTYVNGQRIQESELNAGDTVGVGPVQFIIQIDGVPHEDDITAPVADAPRSAPPSLDDDDDELMTEQPEVSAEAEELNQEDSISEHAPLMELDEMPPEDELQQPLSEEPLDEASTEELDEFDLEEAPVAEQPSAAAQPATVELDEFKLEKPAAGNEPTIDEEVPVVSEVLGNHSGDLNLEESPVDVAPLTETPVGSVDELEEFLLDEAPLETPEATTPASVEELEFDDETFELEPAPEALGTATATKPPEPPAPTDVLGGPAPAPPAYAEVDMGSGDEIEELEFDDEHAEHTPAKAGDDSAWDFVIEETDTAKKDHDFKLDLDSPHEQPNH